MHLMPDPSAAAAALQQGEIDWWQAPAADLLPLLRKSAKNRQLEATRTRLVADAAPRGRCSVVGPGSGRHCGIVDPPLSTSLRGGSGAGHACKRRGIRIDRGAASGLGFSVRSPPPKPPVPTIRAMKNGTCRAPAPET